MKATLLAFNRHQKLLETDSDFRMRGFSNIQVFDGHCWSPCDLGQIEATSTASKALGSPIRSDKETWEQAY